MSSITISTKPHKCTDSESSRYALGNCRAFPAEDGVVLVATDGRKLAAVQCDGELPAPEYVPSAVLPRTVKPVRIERNGRWENDKGAFSEPIPDSVGRFPRVRDAIPESAAGYSVLTIDATYVRQLYEALNTKAQSSITLFIPEANKDGCVDSAIPVLGEKGIGVLMPMTSEKSKRGEYDALAGRVRSAVDVEYPNY